jgi:hypothetical protein
MAADSFRAPSEPSPVRSLNGGESPGVLLDANECSTAPVTGGSHE